MLISLCGIGIALQAQEFREPYLETPTPTSIWINWKTNFAGDSKVIYGINESELSQSIAAETKQWNDAGYNNDYYYHSAHLTNLTPNTKYFYKVVSGQKTSATYSFRTMPLPGKAANKDGKIRFLIQGDNQLKDEPRYDTLVLKAKRYIENKYKCSVNDAISSIIMVGDQVDVGTLDHYENVHFAKNRYTSPYVGTSTVVGNHETYGTLKLGAYHDHFHYDDLTYGGVKGEAEECYAYQAGPLLVICLTTEGSEYFNTLQMDFINKTLAIADKDSTVKFIVSLGHRPYQAEQYIGDISNWIRNTAYPALCQSPKMFMHIGAHHHLYARGQDKDKPVYNIISGGTAWDQYWGMSTEKDFDDVQKTITRWAYQIMEIDVPNDSISVESFSIGYTTKINDWANVTDKFVWEESLPIDSFYRKNNSSSKPTKPTLTNIIKDTLTLPYEFVSSAYKSDRYEYNSVEFDFSQTADFNVIEHYSLKDYENIFGQDDNQFTAKDINKGMDIFKYSLPNGVITNGEHYARVRHRDRNMTWSEWSDPIKFSVKGSVILKPSIAVAKKAFDIGEKITVTYSGTSGAGKDWIGLYKSTQTPGSGSPSITWAYLSAASGTLDFTLKEKGSYYIACFENDGYTEITNRINIFVGATPKLKSDKQEYELNDNVSISFTSAPAGDKDWIGAYRIGHTPGSDNSDKWEYIKSDSGKVEFSGLTKGYYFAQYFLNDGFETLGSKIFFSVGDTIATISVDKPVYNLGDLISVNFENGPGIAKDYLGLYNEGDNPNVNPLVSYVYVDGKPNGKATFKDENLPKKSGSYFIVFFTNDSYNEISNRSYFKIQSSVSVEDRDNQFVKMYPNPSKNDQVSMVESKYPIDKIEIYDVAGQLLYTKACAPDSQNSAIVSHNLPPGSYVVKVYSNKLFTVKLNVSE
jgi:hypothetical protein